MRGSQPEIMVHCSRLAGEPETADWLSPKLTEPFQRHRSVAVGALPNFTVGAIWRHGAQECLPDYELERFVDVVINEDTAVLVKAGLNLNEEGFLLPLWEHPWHRECTQSYCVLVTLPDTRRLVVPCTELIRFYFGSTSALVTQLFLPDLQRKKFCVSDQSSMEGRRRITLAKGMYGRSAEDIARLVSPLAWRNALGLSASLLGKAVSQDKIYPKFCFPFQGTTTLEASGKWVSFAGRERDTFVVFNLRSCTAPFPFTSLSYRLEEAKSATAREQSRPESATAPVQVERSSTPTESKEVTEQDAGQQLKPSARNFITKRKFPDLEGKMVSQSKPFESVMKNDVFVHRKGEGVPEAVGAPSGHRRVRSMNLLEALEIEGGKRAGVPAFLKDLVEQFPKNDPNFPVRVLTASAEDGWSVPAPIFVYEDDGNIDDSLYVSDDEGSPTRPARIAFFEIQFREFAGYLIAVEHEYRGKPGASTYAIPPLDSTPEELFERAIDKARTTIRETTVKELIADLVNANLRIRSSDRNQKRAAEKWRKRPDS